MHHPVAARKDEITFKLLNNPLEQARFDMTPGTHLDKQRRAYLDKVQARMDRWNAEIDQLDAAVREVKADAKIKYHDRMLQLRQKREELRQKVAKIKTTGEEAWEEAKAGIDRVWSEIEDTIESTRSSLKRE